jgi:uncharacterized protein YndB with AHSA1/START domain
MALTLVAAAAPPPASPVISTWTLNTAKATFTPGPGWRSQTRTYTLAPGGGVIVDWVGVGGHGEAMHVSFESVLDGKDYPMTGSANYDTLNAVRVDALTVKSEEKRDGKVVGIAIRKVSADGTVMTITDDGTNRKGEKFSQVLVFERQ